MDFKSIFFSLLLSFAFFYVNKRLIVKASSRSVEEKYHNKTQNMPSWSFLSSEQLKNLKGFFVIVAFFICAFVFYENEDVALFLIFITFILGFFNNKNRIKKNPKG